MFRGATWVLSLGALTLGVGAGCQQAAEETSVSSTEQKIVGGSFATEGAYPWIVEIHHSATSVTDSTNYLHSCGGTLIAPNWVLTAGHCASKKVPLTGGGEAIVALDPSELILTLGEYDSLAVEPPAPGEQEFVAAEIRLHPDYHTPIGDDGNAKQDVHDIALVRLPTNAVLNDKARVIRLASDNDNTPGLSDLLAGWGATVVGYMDVSPTLKQLSSTVVDAANTADPEGGCNARLLAENFPGSGVTYQRAIDPKTEICTRNFNTGSTDPVTGYPDYESACYRDSGSPWITNVSGCPELIGVHFWGTTACVSYNVMDRVSAYLPWIREQGIDYIGDRVYEAESMTPSTGGPFDSTGGSTPDGWNIWTNGYIAFNHTFTGGSQQMVVRASGKNGNGWPRMRVTVGGTNVYEANVTTSTYANYPFTFNAPTGNREVRIYFLNDYYAPPVDRDLRVDKAKVIDTRTTCTASGTLKTQVVIETDWGTGYCAHVNVTNPTATATTSWSLVINTGDSSVYDSWNPDDAYFGTGNHSATPTQTFQKVIPPGGTNSSLGFCANRAPGTTTLPVVVSTTVSF